MRLYFGLALAILLTGGVYCITREAVINEGDSYTFSVVTLGYTVDKCHLKTPTGQIDFVPGDETLSDEKYVIGEGNSLAACELTLQNADENDDGTWQMYFTHAGGTGSVQMYIITVLVPSDDVSEISESESTESEENNNDSNDDTENEDDNGDDNYIQPEVIEFENVRTLSAITHSVAQNAVIDITLNKESFEEECFIRPPNGEIVSTDVLQMEGVIIQSKSYFVSCRVTIGPMTRELSGTWELCGRSTLNQDTRCQPANIAWDGTSWRITTHSMSPQPVHLTGAINTGVSGSGSIDSCHVITPAGEDLVVSSDVKYPHIEFVVTSQIMCRVIISDMTEDLFGNWVVMGRFRARKGGLLENQQPINIFLYNEDEPFAQAYNVTDLQDARHLVHLGGALTLQVSQRAGSVQDCIYRSPAGQTYDHSNYHYNTIEGVSFVSSSSGALCQLVLNPITEQATGVWRIIAKFNNGLLFDKIQQYFEIIVEDPENPIEEDVDRVVSFLTEQVIDTQMDTTHTITITTTSSSVHESCHLITPAGLQYTFIDGFNVPGVEIITGRGIECGISLRLISEDMVGSWTLVTRATTTRPVSYIERRQPFTIRVSGITESESEEFVGLRTLAQIDHSVAANAIIDISLNKEEFEEECYIRPPGGEMIRTDLLQMDGVTVQSKSFFVSCRVTIGPMTRELSGTWTLCGESEANEQTRCQPVNISWDSTAWRLSTNATVPQPVNLGGSVHTGAPDSGTLFTCHVITPAGEDLVISSDVKYPHIEYTVTSQTACSVIFTDLTRDMLGDWVIMGRYQGRKGRFFENRQLLNIFLYNENNPYEQAYNVTELQHVQHLVHLNGDLTVEVSQRAGVVLDCSYRTPSGLNFDLSDFKDIQIEGVSFVSSDTEAVCQIVFSPITEAATGEWQITGKFNNGPLFDKIQRSFELVIEDPENPIEEDVDRVVTYLAEQFINTEMNTSHRIVISTTSSAVHESCHLITPTGLQYTFIDGFHIPGIEIINENRVECGINLNLISRDMIGNWTLLTRAQTTRPVSYIERRQPFTIRVEENFILQDDISITEGADLYLHFFYTTDMYHTCAIYGPDGEEYEDAEEDLLYPESCGFIVRNVDHRHIGKWILEYGADIKRRGSVNVHVLAAQKLSISDLQWTLGSSVDTTLGPEDAVYCKIEDPHKHTIFEDFGQCRIVLNRVLLDHKGLWHMYVGVPGTVLVQTIGFYVAFRDDTSMVTTVVQRTAPSVLMSCTVPADQEVNSCTFRTPHGDTLIATHGVGEDGYMFNGSFVSNYESEADSHDCTLRLVDPSISDLGIWRCGMRTNTGNHFGFLTVVCPHLMQDPEVAASVITEPVLQETNDLSYEEDEPVVMSCSIQTELRYCYFRASNGTVFNVFPTMSASRSYEYVGTGLDAGDCGIRFKGGLSHREGGAWSCHVGLADTSAEEQRASFNVDVRVKMSVHHYRPSSDETMAVVQATVYYPYTIDYCRFVRIDGHGFTNDHLPTGYEIHDGNCTMYIKNPTILDLHPWTVAVKFMGIIGEMSMTTSENLLEIPVDTEIPEDPVVPEDPEVPQDPEIPEDPVDPEVTEIPEVPDLPVLPDMPDIITSRSKTWIWILLSLVAVVSAVAAFAFIPRRNREWTYRRASRLSNSFRNSWDRSFRKQPLPDDIRHNAHVQNSV